MVVCHPSHLSNVSTHNAIGLLYSLDYYPNAQVSPQSQPWPKLEDFYILYLTFGVGWGNNQGSTVNLYFECMF